MAKLNAPTAAQDHNGQRGIERVVARIAVPYAPRVDMLKGWRPLVAQLDEELARLDRDYRIQFIRAYKGHFRVELVDNPHRSRIATK